MGRKRKEYGSGAPWPPGRGARLSGVTPGWGEHHVVVGESVAPVLGAPVRRGCCARWVDIAEEGRRAVPGEGRRTMPHGATAIAAAQAAAGSADAWTTEGAAAGRSDAGF